MESGTVSCKAILLWFKKWEMEFYGKKNQREKRVYVNGNDFALKTKWDKNL